MLIKNADNKQSALDELSSLLQLPNLKPAQQKAIRSEINMMRAGIRGEQEAAYQINFHYKGLKNSILLHDLRIEVGGRVAQIDHLIINRTLQAFMLETKNFSSGIKINENEEFLRWDRAQRRYLGMPSPIAQNQRHALVLNDFFSSQEMPSRLGIRLMPTIVPIVLMSSDSSIQRPKELDTSSVIKSEMLKNYIDNYIDKLSTVKIFGSIGRIVSIETLVAIGGQLKQAHRPISVDYKARFGIREPVHDVRQSIAKPMAKKPPAQVPTAPEGRNPTTENTPQYCSKCQSDNTQIVHGRYGYYFKCQDCGGNTGIKLSCRTEDCKPKLRKQALQFFKECPSCNSSQLFYENSAKVI